MALTATVYNFEIDLADHDRGVYDTLALRVARHPSESEEYLVARVLAYCVEYREGIAFSRGVSDPDDPAIAIRDLTGAILAWIDIGTPDGARLHRASKAASRVAVYCHKEPTQWLRQLDRAAIHRAADLELYALDRRLVDALTARLDRRVPMSLTVSERELFVAIGNETIAGAIERL